MLSYRVGSADPLRRAAADLRDAPDRFEAAIIRELQAIPAGLRPLVQVEMARVLPARYAPVVAAALQVVTTLGRRGWVSAQVKGKARGKRRMRDLDSLDRGALRHPVFGRRTVWATTQVEPGLWRRPTEGYVETIVSNIDAALRRVADEIEGG